MNIELTDREVQVTVQALARMLATDGEGEDNETRELIRGLLRRLGKSRAGEKHEVGTSPER